MEIETVKEWRRNASDVISDEDMRGRSCTAHLNEYDLHMNSKFHFQQTSEAILAAVKISMRVNYHVNGKSHAKLSHSGVTYGI
jgi:hypothetical protein